MEAYRIEERHPRRAALAGAISALVVYALLGGVFAPLLMVQLFTPLTIVPPEWETSAAFAVVFVVAYAGMLMPIVAYYFLKLAYRW